MGKKKSANSLLNHWQQQNPAGGTIKTAAGDLIIPPVNTAVNPGTIQPQVPHINNNISNDTVTSRFQEVHSPQPTTEPNDPENGHKTWFTRPDIHYIKNELTSGTSSLVSSIESIIL